MAFLSCHDKYLLKSLQRNNLCQPCTNYLLLIPKKKAQSDMGRRFSCVRPSAEDDRIPNINIDVDDVSKCSARDTSSEDDSACELLSPPRKSVRASPRRIAHHRIKRSPRRPSVRRNLSACHVITPPSAPLEVMPQEELILALNKERDINNKLQTELDVANATIKRLSKKDQESRNKLRSHVIGIRSSKDPYKSTCHSIKMWIGAGMSNDVIVDSMISAICVRSRMRSEFCLGIQRNESILHEASAYFQNKMYQQIRYKFRPWVCLQELDMIATVSFRSYDAIRMIEFAEEDNKKYRRGLFYSRHKLSHLCRLLENYGQDFLPYEITDNSVKFDVKRAVRFLLEKHGLWHRVLNREQILLSATVDGGDLAWKVQQVSAGVKMIDEKAINPLTGMSLFGNTGFDKVQSKFHCYPLYVIIAKDNKHLYQTHLSHFFHSINELEDDYPEGLKIAQGADMCSLHKTLGVGGGMKVKTYACYCCNVHRDNLIKPLDNSCDDCVRLGRTTEPCYHTSVSDESVIRRLKEQREEYLREWPHLHQLPFRGQSRLRIGNTGMNCVVEPKHDNLHIEFEPNSRLERVQHRNLLEKEAQLRSITDYTNLTVAELKLQLHEILLIEQSFLMLDSIINATNFDEAMIRLEQALPCLLHLENRSSETVVEHLLRMGMRLREGNKAATDQFVAAVEQIMNEEIFGMVGCSSLWSFPLHDNGTVGKIKFANWRVRRVVHEIDDIINLCIIGADANTERLKWQTAISLYRRMMEVLQQKENFTDCQIDEFQCIADDFFAKWIDLTGYDGITNYIHMLGAGHIRFFLKKWRNLNRFQNQGWEAYNGMIAAFWHHRTRKGGGKSERQRSKILPIARWILRLMLWRTGVAQEFFRKLEMENNYNDDIDDYDDSDSDNE